MGYWGTLTEHSLLGLSRRGRRCVGREGEVCAGEGGGGVVLQPPLAAARPPAEAGSLGVASRVLRVMSASKVYTYSNLKLHTRYYLNSHTFICIFEFT